MTLVLATLVALTNSFGSIAVDTLGATLRSYVPAGGREVLFASAAVPPRDPANAGFNGGAPFCFPWVYDDEGRRVGLHGTAAFVEWHRLPSAADELKFGAETEGYAVEAVFRLGRKLSVAFSAKNLVYRDTPRRFTFALHAYFAVSDLEGVRLAGLPGGEVTGREHMKGAAAARTASIVDPGFGRRIRIESPETAKLVYWNCGNRPYPGYAEGEWRRFLCLEPANNLAEDAFVLAPGETKTVALAIGTEKP